MEQVDVELALKKRYPEGVALIVCKDEKGMIDVTPVGWFMLCNSKPRCWVITLNHKHYSHKVISETKEFALCLPSGIQKGDILYCGSVSGWKEDKLKRCKFKIIPSLVVQPPILEDCVACFECKVINKVSASDHTLFIGEIVAAYTSDRKDKVYSGGEGDLIDWGIK